MMGDDEKMEQLVQDRGLLTPEQVEEVREAIRQAAERGEELSFMDAAVAQNLLTRQQADELLLETDRQTSSAETEDISEAMPENAADDTADEAKPEAEQAQPPAEGEGPVEEVESLQRQKPPYAAVAAGVLIILVLIMLVAWLNR